MNTVHPSRLLKVALLIDAVVSGATGVLQLAAATPLGLPRAVLVGTGEFFVLYALLLLWMATRVRLASGLVGLIAVGNALWGLACVLMLVTGALSPNGLGMGYVLVQAAAVLGFALMQWQGLRKSLPTDAELRAARG